MLKLWQKHDTLSTFSDVEESSLPVVDRPFRMGADLLVNAYGSRAYTIDKPSEVLLNVGDVKSITLVETRQQGCTYKIRYRDDTVSFGLVGLRATETGDLLTDYFSTASLMGYLYQPALATEWYRLLEAPLDIAGGQEFALVATLVRDFFCL
jgi:hypothetical protein